MQEDVKLASQLAVEAQKELQIARQQIDTVRNKFNKQSTLGNVKLTCLTGDIFISNGFTLLHPTVRISNARAATVKLTLLLSILFFLRQRLTT